MASIHVISSEDPDKPSDANTSVDLDVSTEPYTDSSGDETDEEEKRRKAIKRAQAKLGKLLKKEKTLKKKRLSKKSKRVGTKPAPVDAKPVESDQTQTPSRLANIGSNVFEKKEEPGHDSNTATRSQLNEVDKIFEAAANDIAKIVSEIMATHGYGKDEASASNEKTAIGCVPLSLPHEAELEVLVRPETLRTTEWQETLAPFPNVTQRLLGLEPNDEHKFLLKGVIEGLQVVNSKLDRVLNIQHLQSVAHLNVVKTCNLLRVLCLSDGPDKDRVYKSLNQSLRVVVLSSDSDLKKLPFNTLTELETFFSNTDRIQKLAYYLLSYVEFGKAFADNVIRTVFSASLVRSSYWSLGVECKKGYVRIYERESEACLRLHSNSI